MLSLRCSYCIPHVKNADRYTCVQFLTRPSNANKNFPYHIRTSQVSGVLDLVKFNYVVVCYSVSYDYSILLNCILFCLIFNNSLPWSMLHCSSVNNHRYNFVKENVDQFLTVILSYPSVPKYYMQISQNIFLTWAYSFCAVLVSCHLHQSILSLCLIFMASWLPSCSLCTDL